jgi:hypothetical protein
MSATVWTGLDFTKERYQFRKWPRGDKNSTWRALTTEGSATWKEAVALRRAALKK